MSRILDEIVRSIDSLHLLGQKSLAVFDLDSTLFCVSPRTQSILRALAEDQDLRDKYPEFAGQLAQLEVTPSDWGIRSVLTRHRVLGPLDFFESVRSKWAERFFSSHHLLDDKPYPGAVDFVRELEKMGTEIRYLTGRDRPRMGDGTIQSLKAHGFPLKEEKHLHMKPDTTRHDAEFKRDILLQLHRETPKMWFFENEPVIVNLVKKDLPDLQIIFMESVHSGREEAPTGLPRLQMTFERKKRD